VIAAAIVSPDPAGVTVMVIEAGADVCKLLAVVERVEFTP
jgi:hypothetical protein